METEVTHEHNYLFVVDRRAVIRGDTGDEIMSKFRIVVFESSNENLDGVTVFRMKPDATDTSDVNSWEMVGTYNGLTSAFFRNDGFKPSDFRIMGDKFSPITLQNF